MNYIREYAKRLHDNGYTLLPITFLKKFPVGLPWHKLAQTPAAFKSWEKDYEGLGINCCDMACGDADVHDEKLVQQMFDYLAQVTDQEPIERIGQSPKTMFVFRCDEPMRKMTTPWFISPDGKRNRFEWLAQGQQFVAFAIHPATREPYEWPGESPLTLRRDQFPLMTKDIAENAIGVFTVMMARMGWTEEKPGTNLQAVTSTPPDRGEQFLDNHKPPINITAEGIQGVLAAVPMSYWDDYDNWIKIGMALYHQTGGDPAGLQWWDRYSQRSSHYTSGCCDGHWQSFHREPHEVSITFATVVDWSTEIPLDVPLLVPAQGVERNLVEFQSVKRSHPKMYFDPCFGPGTSTLLYGEAGLGKSFLVWDMLRALHEGGTWLGFQVNLDIKPVSLMVDGEMPGDLLADRIDDVFTESYPASCYLFSVQENLLLKKINYFNLAAPVCRDEIDKMLVRTQANVLILDNKQALVTGIEENSAGENQPVINWLIEVRARGIMVILVHHANKSGTQRGTNAYEGAVDNILKITRGPGGQHSRYLFWEKARRGMPDRVENGQQLLVMSVKGDRPVTFTVQQNDSGKMLTLLEHIASFPANMSQSKRQEKLRWTRQVLRTQLDKAVESKYVAKENQEYTLTKTGRAYRLEGRGGEFGKYEDEE